MNVRTIYALLGESIKWKEAERRRKIKEETHITYNNRSVRHIIIYY